MTMEGLLLLLLIGGCTVGMTSPVVSPIVVLILLASATLRSKVTPFFRVGMITGLMLLVSYSVAFSALHLQSQQMVVIVGGLCFVLMGIQLGMMLPGNPTTATGWLAVVGRSVLWNFVVGYLMIGMMVLVLFLLQNFSPRYLFDAIGITMILYPSGLFLVAAVASGLTKLGLDYYQRWKKTKPPSAFL
jgi:hypothetical protein